MPTSYRRLNQQDRDTIHRLLRANKTQKEIAEVIDFTESTISREISRNSGKRGYRPKQAGKLAAGRKLKQRRTRKITGDLAAEVEARLQTYHSPESETG